MTRNSSGTILAFISILLTCACSSAPDSGTAVSFQVPHDAKVIFYAVYGNPDDRPVFGETFRFRVDGGYIAGIDETKYIEADIPQGDHEFSVDEIGWAGMINDHSTLKMSLKAGSTYYISEHIRPDDQKPALLNIGGAQGAKDILGRMRVGPC